MKKSISWGLIGILILTVLIGCYLRIESSRNTIVDHPFRGDARDYYMYAYNLRFKQTYSKDVASLRDQALAVRADALRVPGYPLFLSTLVDGPPDSRIVKKIIFGQMLLSNLVLVLTIGFYKRFLSGYWTIAALLMMALCPHLIVVSSFILSEIFFSFVLVLSSLLLTQFFFRPSLFLAAVSGLALGAAALTRPGIQYFPLIVAVLLGIHFGRKQGILFATALLLGYMVILSPWFFRNLKTIDSVSDNTLRINFLHHGMYPDFKYIGIEKSYGYPYRYDPHSNEFSKSTATVINEIVRRFRDEPVKHLNWYLIKKPAFFWQWSVIQGFDDVFIFPIRQTPYQSNIFFNWTHGLMRALHWPLVILCAIGCFLVWLPCLKNKYTQKSLLIARYVSALLLYFTAIHIIGAPFPRYSIPLRPFQYGMAIFCIHNFYILLKTKMANI